MSTLPRKGLSGPSTHAHCDFHAHVAGEGAREFWCNGSLDTAIGAAVRSALKNAKETPLEVVPIKGSDEQVGAALRRGALPGFTLSMDELAQQEAVFLAGAERSPENPS